MVTRGRYDSDMPWYEFRQSSVCVVLISVGWENGCNNISESMRERKHVITSCPTLIYRHKLKLPRLLFTVLSLPPCASLLAAPFLPVVGLLLTAVKTGGEH